MTVVRPHVTIGECLAWPHQVQLGKVELRKPLRRRTAADILLESA